MLGFVHCQSISAFCFLSFFLFFLSSAILKTKLINILVAATVKSLAFRPYK